MLMGNEYKEALLMTSSANTAASRFRTLDLAYIALFAVLMALCAWITVPLPKPLVQFTMQTFAMFMALLVLGGRRGLYAMVVYLLLGAVGMPVFSGFRGGMGVLLDTTGGYIIGFVAAALVYWLVTARLGESLLVSAPPACWALRCATPSAPPGSWCSTPGPPAPSA